MDRARSEEVYRGTEAGRSEVTEALNHERSCQGKRISLWFSVRSPCLCGQSAQKKSTTETQRSHTEPQRFFHFSSAYCLLLSACCLLSGPAAESTATNTNTVARAFAFTFADTAAELASMGSRNVIPRIAVRPDARDCADRIRRDVVCNRRWARAL